MGTKKQTKITILISLLVFLISSSFLFAQTSQSTNSDKKKGALIVVGDANLTYASYFFELPLGWIPAFDSQTIALTERIGFWKGMQEDGLALIRIGPTKKDPGDNLDSHVDSVLQKAKARPDRSVQKYPSFKLSFTYPYEVYLFKNDIDEFDLNVYVELPEYIIVFGLTVKGKDESYVTSYLSDFNKVITSFRWTLGLSDEEIGKLLGSVQ